MLYLDVLDKNFIIDFTIAKPIMEEYKTDLN